MELLSSPHTTLLHENDQFSSYSLSGTFDEATHFTLRGEHLGIFVCLKGTFESSTTALTYQYDQGLVGFAFRHECEKIVPAGTDLLVLFVLFPLATMEGIIEAMGGTVQVALERFTHCQCTVAHASEGILKAASRLYKEATDRCPGYQLMAEMAFREIVVHLLRLFSTEDPPGPDGFLISQLKAYLDQNHHRRIGIDEIARYAGYSKGHLSKLFKRATGQSFVQYLNALRIHKACERIRANDCPVESIAFDSGFRSVNHFYKVFKRVTGVLPSTYREGLIY